MRTIKTRPMNRKVRKGFPGVLCDFAANNWGLKFQGAVAQDDRFNQADADHGR